MLDTEGQKRLRLLYGGARNAVREFRISMKFFGAVGCVTSKSGESVHAATTAYREF